jgi:thiol-disulfide isomerase/thioredoxin
MAIRRIGFTVGLVAGIALTLIVLDLWGRYLDRAISEAAQPRVLRPMRPTREAVFLDSSRNLPAAWLPEFSGQQHDAWRVRSLDGHEVTLGGFKGKVVFLNFWSTSCEPCIAEMPGLAGLLNSEKNEKVAFLAVTDEDENTVREFLKKHPLRIPVYLSSNKPPFDLLAQGIPTTFILDTHGAAMLRHSGSVNWDDDNVRAYIQSLLK